LVLSSELLQVIGLHAGEIYREICGESNGWLRGGGPGSKEGVVQGRGGWAWMRDVWTSEKKI